MSPAIMPEYELLRLAQAIIANQYSILAQIIGLNSAMVVANFVFLHRTRRLLRGFVFFMYSVGFAIYVGILISDSLQIQAVEAGLRELAAHDGLTVVGQGFLSQTRMLVGGAIDFLTQMGLGVLYVGMAVFVFFWKPPQGWSDLK
jgi:hypothetical protein